MNKTVSTAKYPLLKFPDSKEQILEDNAILCFTDFDELSKLEPKEKFGIDFDEILSELKEIVEDSGNIKIIQDPEDKHYKRKYIGEHEISVRELLAWNAWRAIKHQVFRCLRLIDKTNATDIEKHLMKCALKTAFPVGGKYKYLSFLKYEKDLVQKLRMEANKNKNNPEYWAKMLELEYQKQASKISEKRKKSNCYYTIAEEYEKEHKGKKEAPSHKTLRRWWKKYYPQRFEA